MLSSLLPHWMNANAFACMLWALGALLGTQSLASAQNAKEARRTQPAEVEEIYIARSIFESSVAPTEFCAQARTGFNSTTEDQFSFRATASRTSDGRMLDTNVKKIGSGHGCTGPTADPAVFNFYLELLLGNTALKGIGDCRLTKSDFPERGLRVVRCFLDLSDPLGRYVGGQLTTNTMGSLKVLGANSDPPGYVQPSIATIRLWKKRAER